MVCRWREIMSNLTRLESSLIKKAEDQEKRIRELENEIEEIKDSVYKKQKSGYRKLIRHLREDKGPLNPEKVKKSVRNSI
jgi:hypothetical protein